MGKIVKFCSSCDEGFAEKFGFCPNCGVTLQTFEMNPVVAEARPAAVETSSVLTAPEFVEPVEEPNLIAEETAPAMHTVEAVEETVIEEPVVEEPMVEAPAPIPPVATATAFVQRTPVDVDLKRVSLEAEHNAYISEGEFYVTVIEEKNTGRRNGLMLGTLGIMIFSLMTGLVYNLFSKDLKVGAINDDIFNALLLDEVPAVIEELKEKDKDDGGGGGGGGREEEEETTQGDLADQAKNPTRPPDAKVYRSDNFELVTPPPQTEGNRTFENKFDRWGDPNGRFASFSNGTGSGGGQGSGVGTGQGSGRGTGAGSGDGSGSGGGLGSGNGDGTGSGGAGPPPPPPKKAGVTQAMRVTSKPQPKYTDSARLGSIQGQVVLRVTFLGSGQIGSISTIKGLAGGLTEQAIAAARRITFEPKRIDGVGQSVTRQVEYTFSIY